MTTLAADKPREYDISEGLQILERAAPVVATDIIYEGAAVGRNSAGNAGPLTDNAGGLAYFLGFAIKRADNAAGAAGAVRVDLVKEGRVKLNVTGVDGIDDHGKTVYATDDDTFTLTEGTGGYAIIGKIAQWIGADGFRAHGATTCFVDFIAHDRSEKAALNGATA